MNKTALIFKHEFRKTIKRTGFIILTLLIPVLALLFIGISHLLSGITKPPVETYNIGYVDEAGGFAPLTEDNTAFIRFDTTRRPPRHW
jgi:ABC-2 type transport system permease protein